LGRDLNRKNYTANDETLRKDQAVLLKNKHFQIKLAKDADPATGTFEPSVAGVTEIAEIAVDAVTKTVIVVGGVIAANHVLKTICEVAVVVTKAKIK
jgi:hypothetical protein